MSKVGISVVIPNYNGRNLFPVTLPTVYEALYAAGLPFEIIICDDASSDDSVSYIRTHFPDICLITSAENKGFSITINRGIFKAQYSFILLLNSDVKLTKEYLLLLLPYFNDESTFGVMGRIVGWDDDIIQDGAKWFKYEGFKIKTSYNYIPVGKPYKQLPTFFLSGANSLVSKKKIWQIGGFNELFSPFYIEDVELSIRAWRMGWNCFYEHNAVCRHKLSATVKATALTNYVQTVYNRNKFFLHELHLPKIQLFFWRIQIALERSIQKALGKTHFNKAYDEYRAARNKIKIIRHNFEKNHDVLSLDKVKKHFIELLGKTRIQIFKR